MATPFRNHVERRKKSNLQYRPVNACANVPPATGWDSYGACKENDYHAAMNSEERNRRRVPKLSRNAILEEEKQRGGSKKQKQQKMGKQPPLSNGWKQEHRTHAALDATSQKPGMLEEKNLKQQDHKPIRAAQEKASGLDAVALSCRAGQRFNQQVNGGPVAEVEKVLREVAPSLCFGVRVQRSYCCSVMTSSFRSFRAIAEISLRKLWDWYEQPSSCGLGVRLCSVVVSEYFNAYFVPSLSAIRLSKRLMVENRYEFSETEQPQLRVPLFQKIRLLSRDGCGRGDPSLLDESFGQLHPSSWFAVAWYPIYKIPEGQLRSAFLTYHSLGHWRAEARVVSFPVIGLQTYNCEPEQWFASVEPSALMNDRLLKLNEAARALSSSDSFSHPDYDFFVSRKRA